MAASLPIEHWNVALPVVRPIASLAAALVPETDAARLALQVLPATTQVTDDAAQSAAVMGDMAVVVPGSEATGPAELGGVPVASAEDPPPPHEIKRFETIKTLANLMLNDLIVVGRLKSMIFLKIRTKKESSRALA